MSKRLSLILGDGDQVVIEPFTQSGTDQNEALRRWAESHGAGAVTSEAAVLRVLLQAGAESLRDDALDAGYADLAALFSGDVERSERNAARVRYAARADADR